MTRKDRLVDHVGAPYDAEAGAVRPMVVLARIPNMTDDAPEASGVEEAVGLRRWLSQSLSFRLLAGVAAILLTAAVLPCLTKKKDSSTGQEHSTWQTAVPAPMADAAPGWVAPKAALQAADTNGDGTGGLTATTSANAAAGIAQTAGMSLSEDVPLTWDSFSRRYDAEMASSSAAAGSVASRQVWPTAPNTSGRPGDVQVAASQSAANRSIVGNNAMPHAAANPDASRLEPAMPVYRATSTPDLLTIEPATTASSGREQPTNSWR